MATEKRSRSHGRSGTNGNRNADMATLGYYCSRITPIPVLSPDEQQELAQRARDGDEEALKQLVEHNLKFVVKFAKQYRGCGLSLIDLISEGNIGLIEGLKHYKSGHNTVPTTYATWWIRRQILRALAETTQTIRKPLYRHRILLGLQKTEQRLRQKLCRKPNSAELAEELQQTIEEIDILRQCPWDQRDVSLDAKLREQDGNENKTLGDLVAVEPGASQLDTVISRDSGRTLQEVMQHLTEQERNVLERRFGMNGYREQTLKEASEDLGISRERVRQIERQAKLMLKKLIKHPMLAARHKTQIDKRKTRLAKQTKHRAPAQPVQKAVPSKKQLEKPREKYRYVDPDIDRLGKES